MARTPTEDSSSYALPRPIGIERPTIDTISWFLLPSCLRFDGKHVVFGKVVEGMEIFKALEAGGSQSGKTSVLV